MLVLWVAGCALHSGLNIESGQSFALGENRHGAFRAAVENDGAMPVEVLARSDAGERVLGSLAPGEKANVRFADGETAIFVNRGAQKAHVDVDVRGDTNLSMAYEPIE